MIITQVLGDRFWITWNWHWIDRGSFWL